MSDPVLRAFLERLNAYDTELPVAYLDRNYDGSEFDTPDTGIWLESRYFPNEHDDILWADDSPVQMGFFQVSVYFRNDVNEARADAEATNVIAQFPRGLQINGGIRIKKRPWKSPKITLDAMSFIQITIPYYGMGEAEEETPDSPLLTGLISAYQLDEASGDRSDSHTNNFDLTDNNTVGSNTGEGGTGTAADFTAANSEYLHGATTNLNGSIFTANVWFYVNPGFTGVGYFFGIGESTAIGMTGNLACRAWVEGDGSQVTGTFIDVFDGTTTSRAQVTTNLAFSSWNHARMGYNDTSAFLSVNGGAESVGVANGGPRSISSPVIVLGWTPGVNPGLEHFDGRLQSKYMHNRLLLTDEAAFFAASARSYAEVQAYTP